MTTPKTYVQLLDSVRDHLASSSVPARIAAVEVLSTSLDGDFACVQLCGMDLPALAFALLAWADTLTEVTATAWRPPSGDRVHLSVSGRLADGLPIKVYSGVPYLETVFGADLQPDGRQRVALGVLRAWAMGGAVAA